MIWGINEQFYPDGVDKELKSHYHWITLRNFQNFADLLETSDHSVSAAFKASLERMWNYLTYSMRPEGYSVLNNDSDRDYNQPLVNKAAAAYQRADWVSSKGKFGQKPGRDTSRDFP